MTTLFDLPATKPSTAKRGNPLASSRGAAAKRARMALGDAIDRVLGIEAAPDASDAETALCEEMELEHLRLIVGAVDTEAAKRWLTLATLGELQTAIAKASIA